MAKRKPKARTIPPHTCKHVEKDRVAVRMDMSIIYMVCPICQNTYTVSDGEWGTYARDPDVEWEEPSYQWEPLNELEILSGLPKNNGNRE